MNRREFLEALGGGVLGVQFGIPPWLPPKPMQWNGKMTGTRVGLISSDGDVVAARMLPMLVPQGVSPDGQLKLGFPEGANRVEFPMEWMDEATGMAVTDVAVLADLKWEGEPFRIERVLHVGCVGIGGSDTVTVDWGDHGIIEIGT